MNPTKPFALLFITLFVMISCSRTSNYQYEELEMLIETQPKVGLDSVCHLIKNDDGKDKYTSNKLALLKYMAEIKCKTEHKSDSTIIELANYFEENGSNADKMKSHFCLGTTYADMEQFPQAIIHYNEAVSIGESKDISKYDSICLANTYYKLGMKMGAVKQNKLYLDNAKKTQAIKKELGIEDILSIQNLANAYHYNNIIDSAEFYFKNNAMNIICNKSIRDYTEEIGEQLYFFSTIKNEEMANMCLHQLQKTNIDSLSCDVLSYIVQYYIHIKLNTDSCLYYNKLAYEKEKEYDGKSNKARNLSILYAYLKDYENSSKYAYLSFTYSDTAEIKYKLSETAAAQSQYQSKELDKMRSCIHEEEIQRNQYLAYGATAIMTILAILGFSLYIQSKKNNKILAEKEQIESDKKKIEEKHQQLQEVMDADNKLRAESAKDISAVIALLNSIADDGRVALTEDNWDDIFMAVDKLYPNFRSHVISYYPVIENKDLIIIYLVMLGMKQADVARLFNNARSVVHRKFHRIEEKLGITISDIIDDYKEKELINN